MRPHRNWLISRRTYFEIDEAAEADDFHVVYLSGPMSGCDDFNFPKFNKYAAELRELGLTVLNPAETAGGVDHLPREWYFQLDFSNILAADAVFLMPGWEGSQGACAEIAYAAQLGKPVYIMYRHGLHRMQDIQIIITHG